MVNDPCRPPGIIPLFLLPACNPLLMWSEAPMGKRLTMVFMALAGVAAGYLLNGYGVSAQQGASLRIAAIPSEKGGQDIWGPYLPQEGWPKDLTTLPGHEGWTFGAGQSVFAQ